VGKTLFLSFSKEKHTIFPEEKQQTSCFSFSPHPLPFPILLSKQTEKMQGKKQASRDRKMEESKVGEMLSSLSIRIAWEGQYYYII
jgi:hypothetical protein